MTPAQAAKAIDKILMQPGTKADRARALFQLGLTRSEVAELARMNYSQAHSVWKGMQDGESSDGVRSSRVRELREVDEGASRGARQSDRRALHLTPTQTRYATQDGHEVVRVDRDTGATCLHCGKEVHFALVHLAFVHKRSKSEPTQLEDRYEPDL